MMVFKINQLAAYCWCCYSTYMKYVILHNIRSAYNVGAVFRTADGAGIKKIFLTGYTPAPTDRFGREQAEIKKTSLGASKIISWERGDFNEIVERLQKENTEVVAVEQAANSISLPCYTPVENTAYILGKEITGIEEQDLVLVNKVVDIPMRGKKESLNVSVAAGIVMYHGTL